MRTFNVLAALLGGFGAWIGKRASNHDDHTRQPTESPSAGRLPPRSLAKAAGLKEDHYRDIENGKVDFPRKQTLERLMKVLGVRVSVVLVEEHKEIM